MPAEPSPPPKNNKRLGLALSAGAARGWAHIGVLQALEEINVKPDLIAGCSVGALVGGAYLCGALPAFERWARELGPLSAISAFSLAIGPGGLVNSAAAFEAFREYDCDIKDLPVEFAAVAADLGTGEEIWLRDGSLVDALRASSAIPVLFHAVRRDDRWLIDGAVANPTPVSLARTMGADVVIAVDLNAVPRVLDRFNPPPPSVPAIIPARQELEDASLTAAVRMFIADTQKRVRQGLSLAKARHLSKPQLFETAYAAADIFQMHLARARLHAERPDILLTPDMRDAMPTSFDRADEFIEKGYLAVMNAAADINALLDR